MVTQVPLETLVESEPVRPWATPRGAACAWRPMPDATFSGCSSGRRCRRDYRAQIVAAFPFPALTDDERTQLDAESVAFVDVMGSRVPDGRQMCAAFSASLRPSPRVHLRCRQG